MRESDADETEEAIDHDPGGLDLARRIAASIGAGPAPVRPRRRATRRKEAASRPYESGRDPAVVGDVFGRMLHDRGWSTQVNIHLLLGNWPRLVGPINADHSRPEKFAEGVLVVRTDSTAWATQLRLIAPNLVAKLNAELGDGSVRAVQVKGPDAPSWKKGPRSVAGRGPRDTYG